jgi:glucose-6-phosphate 1-dehydrogenase
VPGERLFGDAISGDPTLFARQDVVDAAWAIVDPLIKNPGPVLEYEPGSWGPPLARNENHISYQSEQGAGTP